MLPLITGKDDRVIFVHTLDGYWINPEPLPSEIEFLENAGFEYYVDEKKPSHGGNEVFFDFNGYRLKKVIDEISDVTNTEEKIGNYSFKTSTATATTKWDLSRIEEYWGYCSEREYLFFQGTLGECIEKVRKFVLDDATEAWHKANLFVAKLAAVR